MDDIAYRSSISVFVRATEGRKRFRRTFRKHRIKRIETTFMKNEKRVKLIPYPIYPVCITQKVFSGIATTAKKMSFIVVKEPSLRLFLSNFSTHHVLSLILD